MVLRFEWDPEKAASNLRKHGVSFETATRVFADPLALAAQDRIEGWEARWKTIGMVGGCQLLVVAHTVRDRHGTEIVRIISARRAERQELRLYEEADG